MIGGEATVDITYSVSGECVTMSNAEADSYDINIDAYIDGVRSDEE